MAIDFTDSEHVALYDTVTGYAFGPTFESKEAAEDFSEWVAKKAANNEKFNYGYDKLFFREDVRIYNPAELYCIHEIWKQQGVQSGTQTN